MLEARLLERVGAFISRSLKRTPPPLRSKYTAVKHGQKRVALDIDLTLGATFLFKGLR